MRCTSCARIWDVPDGGGPRRPRNRPAVARWTHRPGVVVYVCQSTLDNWFDNADDDPEMEPYAVEWLVVTTDNTTVQDELAATLGACILARLTPNTIARLLLRTGWQPPPTLAYLHGMTILRD